MSVRFILLYLALWTGRCIGGRGQYIKTEVLRNSPLGIGIQNALNARRHFSSRTPMRQSGRKTRISEQCQSEPSKHDSIFASVAGGEPKGLRLVLPPFLRPKPRDKAMEELECLEEEVIPCSSERIYDPNEEQQRSQLFIPMQTEEKRQTLHVTNAGRRSKPLKLNNNHKTTIRTSDTRGGNALSAVRPLMFWENMVSGAVSRSVAQTIMHPANTMKTILQSTRGADRPTLASLMRPEMFKTLTRGAGANFVLSIPHGAVNFAVLEFVRGRLNTIVDSVPLLAKRADSIGPGLDFLSSAISTITCSVVSTPQMMITDNIMAGNYPRLDAAVTGLYAERGLLGFYAGWWPGLVGKIPSYALTWTFFQQLKRMRSYISDEPVKNIENSIMGSMASATTVCIMIPLDTIKTRLVTQMSANAATGVPYKGIIDCAIRITREEGIKTFYRGLPPRLISVVPMIGIQFGVYEAMKKVMLQANRPRIKNRGKVIIAGLGDKEVAEDGSNPFPAPHIVNCIEKNTKSSHGFGRSRRLQLQR